MNGLSIGAVLLTAVLASSLNCAYARFSSIRHLADLTDSEALVDVIRVKLLNNAVARKVKQNAQKSVTEIDEIRFSFDPTGPTREMDEPSVHMVMSKNGETHTFLFDRNGSTVVGVYKGVLSQTLKAPLILRIEEAIKETKGAVIDRTIIRESDLFSISVKFKTGTTESISGLVEDTPSSVRPLINDLRILWKQFSKVVPAAAYVRSHKIEKERLTLLLKEGKLRFTKIEEFPPDLQSTLKCVTNMPADFHPVTRSQLERLSKYASFGEVFLTDGEAGYQVSFFTPKQDLPGDKTRPSNEPIDSLRKGGEKRSLHPAYNPRHRVSG